MVNSPLRIRRSIKHIIQSYPNRKFEGGLIQLHEDSSTTVKWLGKLIISLYYLYLLLHLRLLMLLALLLLSSLLFIYLLFIFYDFCFDVTCYMLHLFIYSLLYFVFIIFTNFYIFYLKKCYLHK